MTNPPFGANVGSDQEVGGGEQAHIPDDPGCRNRCRKRHGEAWTRSYQRMIREEGANTNVLNLFEIGKGKTSRTTEIIFVERCLGLLKPGGCMGIVLPDGNLNNMAASIRNATRSVPIRDNVS